MGPVSMNVVREVVSNYPTPPSRAECDTSSFIKWSTCRIFFLQDWLPYLGDRSQLDLFIDRWIENNWVRAFPKGIYMK